MGSDCGQEGERPVHRVWVDAFELAVHQVRNRDYAAFLEATAAPLRANGLTPISACRTNPS